MTVQRYQHLLLHLIHHHMRKDPYKTKHRCCQTNKEAGWGSIYLWKLTCQPHPWIQNHCGISHEYQWEYSASLSLGQKEGGEPLYKSIKSYYLISSKLQIINKIKDTIVLWFIKNLNYSENTPWNEENSIKNCWVSQKNFYFP